MGFHVPTGVVYHLADARGVRDAIATALDRPGLHRAPAEPLLRALVSPGKLRPADPTLTEDAETPVDLHVSGDERGMWLLVVVPDAGTLVERLPQLLKLVGPVAKAEWASASPPRAAGAIADRQIATDRGDDTAPSAGWVMYWSPATCDELRFSLDDPRAKLFARAEPAAPGVCLQLTEEPLDLDRPEHLSAFTAACEAFPEL